MRAFLRKGVLIAGVDRRMIWRLALPTVASAQKMYIPSFPRASSTSSGRRSRRAPRQAAKQYGVDITFEGPPTEADIQPQVQMLVNAMAKNPAAICLAALDTNSVMDQLNQAIQRKIPIIGFDSGVPNAPKGAIYATAATNSYNAAGLAADKMFAAIKDKIAAATDAKPGHDRRLQPGRHQPVGDRPRQGLP